MQKSKLTVYFNGAFWVGIYERSSEGELEVCKLVFGAEPKDYEVYEFLLKNWNQLRFSPSVEADDGRDGRVSPKRMQRIIKKQLERQGIGTKSQKALNLQREENKRIHKAKSRRQKEEESERRFELRRQKQKEKHRGR